MDKILTSSICDPRNSTHMGEDFIIIENPDVNKMKGIAIRNDNFSIIYCSVGAIRIYKGVTEINVEAGNIVYIMKGQTYQIIDASDTFKGIVLLLSEQFLQWLDMKRYYYIRNNSGKPISVTSYGAFEKYIGICKNILMYDDNPEKKEVIQLLTKAYIIGLSHFADKTVDTETTKNASKRIMKEFMTMLASEKEPYKSPNYYANHLNISSRYLSFVSRQCTGFSAMHWINQNTIQAAKALLSSSNLDMHMIATKLGFSNQSVFGRFFKRHTGITPLEFRRDLK